MKTENKSNMNIKEILWISVSENMFVTHAILDTRY